MAESERIAATASIGGTGVAWSSSRSLVALFDDLARFPSVAGPGALQIAAALGPIPPAPPSPRIAFFGDLEVFDLGVESVMIRDRGAAAAAVVGSTRVDVTLAAPIVSRAGRLIVQMATHLALRAHGLFHVHAAAVAYEERAWLIAGPSGAGKTSLALALLSDTRFSWLGDDACYLREDKNGVEVIGIPRRFHLSAVTARAFPLTSRHAHGTRDEGGVVKTIVEPRGAFLGREVSRSRLGKLLFPRVCPERTSATVLSRHDAFARLTSPAALALVGGPGDPHAYVRTLASAAGAAAAEIALGPDMLSQPRGTALAAVGLY